MSVHKDLALQEQEVNSHSGEKTLDQKPLQVKPYKFVQPELYEQVILYINNSIPKNLTVSEAFTLIHKLQTTTLDGTVGA